MSLKGMDKGKGVTKPNIICFRCHQLGNYASDCKVPIEGIVAPNPPMKTATEPKPNKAAPVLMPVTGQAPTLLENN